MFGLFVNTWFKTSYLTMPILAVTWFCILLLQKIWHWILPVTLHVSLNASAPHFVWRPDYRRLHKFYRTYGVEMRDNGWVIGRWSDMDYPTLPSTSLILTMIRIISIHGRAGHDENWHFLFSHMHKNKWWQTINPIIIG